VAAQTGEAADKNISEALESLVVPTKSENAL
jgi:hypothetical protein